MSEPIWVHTPVSSGPLVCNYQRLLSNCTTENYVSHIISSTIQAQQHITLMWFDCEVQDENHIRQDAKYIIMFDQVLQGEFERLFNILLLQVSSGTYFIRKVTIMEIKQARMRQA